MLKNVEHFMILIDLFLDMQELCGRLVTVSKAAATGGWAEETLSPRRSVSSTFILFVNNLSPEVDGCELKRLFSGFGEVVHAKVIYHHTGARWESKEFGVVTMATREGLKDAIRGLNKEVSQTLFHPDDGHGS